MTNPERSTVTQRRIDEIEKMLEELRPLCDKQLAGVPRPGPTPVPMCRMAQLERELKWLKGLQQIHSVENVSEVAPGRDSRFTYTGRAKDP